MSHVDAIASAPHGSASDLNSQPEAQQAPQQEICRKFFRKAHCIRGERCPFKHSLTETPAPSAELLAGPSTLENQRQRKRKAERAITRCQEVATAVFRDLNFVDSVGEADLTRLFQPMPLCLNELIQWSSVPDSIQISREFHPDRAERKRWQVDNMASMLDRMLGYYTGLGRPVRIVDFGSGAGNVSLPLAWGFRDRVEITLLDMKPACIESSRSEPRSRSTKKLKKRSRPQNWSDACAFAPSILCRHLDCRFAWIKSGIDSFCFIAYPSPTRMGHGLCPHDGDALCEFSSIIVEGTLF